MAKFNDTDTALQGFRKVQQLDDDGRLKLRNATVVERRSDGTWQVVDDDEKSQFGGAVGGGLVGAVLGVLAGPLGILLGGATGLLAGEVIDVTEDQARESIHEEIIRRVAPGGTALVADVDEPTSHPLDEAMTNLGATVTRWPRKKLQAELPAGM